MVIDPVPGNRSKEPSEAITEQMQDHQPKTLPVTYRLFPQKEHHSHPKNKHRIRDQNQVLMHLQNKLVLIHKWRDPETTIFRVSGARFSSVIESRSRFARSIRHSNLTTEHHSERDPKTGQCCRSFRWFHPY